MKWLYIVALLVLIPVGTAEAQTSDVTIVAIGDSLVDGFCTDPGADFTARLSDWIDIPIINEGIIGDETEDVLARLDQDVFSYNPDVVILLVGGNDILDGDPRAETVANIKEIIETIQAQGAEVLFLGAHGQVFEFNYESDYRAIAAETNAYFVSNVLRDVLGRPALMCDLVHPDNDGHLVIAEQTFPILQDLINTEFPNATVSGSCMVDTISLMTGASASYTTYVVGGGGGYTYDWSGAENISGSGATLQARYNTEGTKDMSVVVNAQNDSATFSCPVVTVMNEPLTATCQVNKETVFIGESIQYSVTARGGSGVYTYDWSGSSELSGTERTVRVSYNTEGTKAASVTVTSDPDGEVTVADCPSVIVTEPALVGSCAVSLEANEATNEVNLQFVAEVSGGDGNFDIDWDTNFSNDPRDDHSEMDIIETFSFSDAGIKRATANVTSAGQSISLTCSAEIPSPLIVEENRITRASCEVNGRPLETGRTFNWTAYLNAGGGETLFDWSGTDGLSGTNRTASIVYDTPGNKTGTVVLSGNGFNSELSCQLVIGQAGEVDPRSGGGCFIATAAFGSGLIYEVETLRKFRDEYLLTNSFGRVVVEVYYQYSPELAVWVSDSPTGRSIVRSALLPIVWLADLVV